VTQTVHDTITSTPKLLDKRWQRRTFLAATGATGAGLALAATAGTSIAAPSPQGDLQTAMLAASLEVLAVATYAAALDAATAGKLGAVPPAVATYAQTAMSQHQFALDSWNAVITGAGSAAVTTPPADLNATVQQMFGQITDIGGVVELALLLEQVAADTYFVAGPTLLSTDAISLAGNLQIIDQQHQAVLLFVLGRYPVPDVFQKGALAYTGSPSSRPTVVQQPR